MKISTCPRPSYLAYALAFLIYGLITTGSGPLAADQTTDKTAAKPGNLHVTSDKLIGEQGNSMVEFIGNVRATRDDAVLLADSVKVYFKLKNQDKNSAKKSNADDKDKTDKGQGNVDKIVATGHVEYTAGDRKAFSDKAVYTTADEKLILTGENPRLLTGKSWVAGKKITLFRMEERVIVESDGKKRVQAFFDSQDQNRKPDQKSKENPGPKKDGTE